MTDYISAIISILILLFSHVVIDSISCCLNKKENVKQTVVFALDQFVHIAILYLIFKRVTFNNIFEDYFHILKLVLFALVLMAPCSITINKLFKDVFSDTNTKGIFDAGSIIGILERILIIIFAYFENFAAIAIIITVKTWARNEDLKENEFRNKYLLGTLTSLVMALLLFTIFKNMNSFAI